ncbi:hypothetical protein F5148DRAFT_151736 [Russula earlei]|uniref:Uncharacterized protein n=1 Tax=Russula earlei TaxID=71964 RepID=A0ACC0U692_9AGAM|nr:hypothetical protein F5148DRAFT_151736 [Russula earlei]
MEERSAAEASSQSPVLWNEEHATLLATKWYDHKKLAELGETEGLVYKKGPFSTIEEQSIKDAIEQYRVQHALTEDDLHKIIFTKQRGCTFWHDVARSVPMRPIKNVFVHVRRAWERTANQGRWLDHEDKGLEQAICELGHSWDAISKRIGRSPANCRDRYRNHLAHRSERRTGAWSPEEVQELTSIVKSITPRQGDSATGISWADVAARMGHKRNGQQCRNKWVQSLHGRDEHSRLEWSKVDIYIFMHKVTSLSVLDESEIIWSKFPDAGWNRWSSYQLRRKWRALKRSVPGHESMTPREIAYAVLQQESSSTKDAFDT